MGRMISVIVVMGVSGCGKTSVGSRLADHLGWQFIESDDFHSAEDIRKMSNGIPLNDEDRWPWLKRLNKALKETIAGGQCVVLACSALKDSYRKMLFTGIENGVVVYLKGSYALIHERMQQRAHFMGEDMLASQFDALEEPGNAFVADIRLPAENIVMDIMREFGLSQR